MTTPTREQPAHVDATILLVDADRSAVPDALTATGCRVTTVDTGADALAMLGPLNPDLIILDLELPDIDGLLLISDLNMISKVPIIVCSTRQQRVDRVLSLRLGADDFVPKPVDVAELEARMAAVLRRARTPDPSAALVLDDLHMSPAGKVVIRSTPVHLTQTEFIVLKQLVAHAGEPVSRHDLGQAVWGYYDTSTDRHLIDVHIGRIRGKLKHLLRQPVILAQNRFGYLIEHAYAI